MAGGVVRAAAFCAVVTGSLAWGSLLQEEPATTWHFVSPGAYRLCMASAPEPRAQAWITPAMVQRFGPVAGVARLEWTDPVGGATWDWILPGWQTYANLDEASAWASARRLAEAATGAPVPDASRDVADWTLADQFDGRIDGVVVWADGGPRAAGWQADFPPAWAGPARAAEEGAFVQDGYVRALRAAGSAEAPTDSFVRLRGGAHGWWMELELEQCDARAGGATVHVAADGTGQLRSEEGLSLRDARVALRAWGAAEPLRLSMQGPRLVFPAAPGFP